MKQYYKTPAKFGMTSIIEDGEVEKTIEGLREMGDEWENCSKGDLVKMDRSHGDICVEVSPVMGSYQRFMGYNHHTFYRISTGKTLGQKIREPAGQTVLK